MTESMDVNRTSTLPLAWQRAIQGRRTMLHYKPAALLTVLDMIEAGSAPSGQFDFAEFDRLFQRRLDAVDAKGSHRGWEPFLHLAIGDHVWELHKGALKSTVPELKPNRSKSYVLS
jgi:hypothetical protein